jgi:hypothetical protein
MSRKLYSSDAERQKAYRERKRLPVLPRQKPPPPRPSRPARLRLLAAEVDALRGEYQRWLDRIPPNLAEGTAAMQLQEVVAQLEEVGALLDAVAPPAVGRSDVM